MFRLLSHLSYPLNRRLPNWQFPRPACRNGRQCKYCAKYKNYFLRFFGVDIQGTACRIPIYLLERKPTMFDNEYISQCCGCPVDVPCPSDPVDDIVVICPDCYEWTSVEMSDL